MALHFDKYAQEANEFLIDFAEELGHPDQKERSGIILKAVMHTLRDRLTISESLDLLAQLPMFLKAVYVDDWKYQEKPLRLKSEREFLDHVKMLQSRYGEQQFDWEISTEDIVKTHVALLRRYVSKGEMEDIIDQMPKEIKPMIEEVISS
ncbi:MAG: DUF2267 domain-containing protein [Bacteroidales bacterium]|nr:DUF2267 domain-containing protein [Bacteroidales bacterium]MCF8345226.1 DUF2267 domain-containing protein [Bacteroidales bacterium]MCF8350434.1 DUF2267 domain-containing protein [Bacteroidales bacterium]MCF8377685.1 DUF2267 domain-containing protein [Bacteroidales bacterium]MCF8401961.1 DUF2267 domain-containing protein [Bacteroidales bacterium]